MQVIEELTVLYPLLGPLLQNWMDNKYVHIYILLDYLFENDWYASILNFLVKSIDPDLVLLIFEIHLRHIGWI